jgi:hypothetical protein
MKADVLSMLIVAAGFAVGQESSLPGAGNVSLTLDEYNRLVSLAGQTPKKIDAPPFPFVVKSAQFKLDARGETVSGSVDLEGEVFVKGDRKVPLVSGMTVLDAREQGRELPIEQSGGVHTALLTGPREFAVTVDTGMPLTIETGRASFNLPAPAAGVARLILTVPGDQTLVNINPGLITAKYSNGGKTTIEATLVPGQMSNVWWAARLNLTAAPPAAPKPARFLSDLKTLISVTDSELTLAALAEITVVQGDPSEFLFVAPDGYELTGATGPTLISSDVQGNRIVVKVEHPEARTHQLLISMAKANTMPKAEVPLLMVEGAQRETGEVLVEGEGAIELTAAEHGGLRRMDIKEVSGYLTSLAHSTLYAAFRYQKKPSELPLVGLEWTRFPDSGILSAVAQQATVTTLVTTEGRTLTEVKLTLKNKAQPFLKVGLPAGASILTADVAGEKVKPVEGADGNRVPLLRPGFKPQNSYTVSFVMLGAGAPFAKKGGTELALPKMDIPIGYVEWEVFLPEQYRVSDFGGDAISRRLVPGVDSTTFGSSDYNAIRQFAPPLALGTAAPAIGPGMIGGVVTDPTGAAVSNAEITVENLDTGGKYAARAGAGGQWIVLGVQSGRVSVKVTSPGFQSFIRLLGYDSASGARVNSELQVGSVSEQVTVNATATLLQTETASVSRNGRKDRADNLPSIPDTNPTANVSNFQRRVAGVLPISVTIPKTGASYRFVRPLVVDEETKLTFSYRR